LPVLIQEDCEPKHRLLTPEGNIARLQQGCARIYFVREFTDDFDPAQSVSVAAKLEGLWCV